MVKLNVTDINIPELISDLWAPLTLDQRERLAGSFTLQTYKKNEIVHSEDEQPTHLFCLLKGKVKVFTWCIAGVRLMSVIMTCLSMVSSWLLGISLALTSSRTMWRRMQLVIS